MMMEEDGDIRSFAAAADCCCMDLPAVGIQYYSSLRAAGTGTVYHALVSLSTFFLLFL